MKFLYLLLVVFVVAGCSSARDTGTAKEAEVPVRPNILTIMVDDLGYNDLAINNNNAAIHTPNMDQFAREGVRFTRHYAASVCSPARASFLTGLYPSRLGFQPNGRGISPDVVTLADRLREEGYTTWHIGKWHVGDLDELAQPDYQGFDHWFGFLNQWRLGGEHLNGRLQLSPPRYADPWLEGSDIEGRNYPGHLEDILTDKAMDVMSDLAREQGPWFLNLWYFAPHLPLHPASEFLAQYPDTRDGRYRALVHQLDHNVGKLLAHLQQLGLHENTIVVLVSDNGGTASQLEGNDNNAPFPGFKTSMNEGGLRTPLVIRWPGSAHNGTVYPGVVSIADIYPALLESIGIAPPDDIDGRSFLAYLDDPASAQGYSLFWEGGADGYSVLSADGRWKYRQPSSVLGMNADPMLFDLEQDPTGATPVIPMPSQVQQQMVREHRAWYRDVHRVQLELSPGRNGDGILTGADFLRTPGMGEYTVGLGVSAGHQGDIAAQGDIWRITRHGQTITAEFGDIVLTGELSGDAACHSVAVTGNFHRRNAFRSRGDEMRLALYIDAIQADSVTAKAALQVIDPTVPTTVSELHVLQDSVVRAPVILNRALASASAWTAQALDNAVCERG